jgi:plastocyanin
MRQTNLCCVLFFLFACMGCKKDRSEGDKQYTVSNDIPVASVQEDSAVHLIEIKQMRFEPAEIRVKKGDKVRWINKDFTNHDVTEQSRKAWASSPLATGESWSMIVTETVDYYCDLHQVMKGKIFVE